MSKKRKNVNIVLCDEMNHLPSEIKKWKIRFKYTDPKWRGGGHSRVKKCRYVGTVEEARAERDHLKHYLKQGLDPDEYPRPHDQDKESGSNAGDGAKGVKTDDSHKTFSELEKIYKRHRKTQDLAETTLTTENHALDDHVMPAIGGWVIQKCALSDFQDLRLKWHDEKVATGDFSSASVNKHVRIMKHFIGWCCRRLGVRHVCRDLKRLPKPKKKKGRALNRDELEGILAKVKDLYPHYYGFFYFAAYTGQRFSTISHLRWSEIDADNNRISFDHSKTGHKASVPLSEFSDVLKFHRKALKKWSVIAFNKSPFVFPCKGDPASLKGGGLRRSTSSLNKALKRSCSKCEVAPVTVHDFRRTFVSLALESGIAPDVIRSLTGHSERMIGHYHHQSQDSKKSLISVVKGTHQEGDDEAFEKTQDSSVTASAVSLG